MVMNLRYHVAGIINKRGQLLAIATSVLALTATLHRSVSLAESVPTEAKPAKPAPSETKPSQPTPDKAAPPETKPTQPTSAEPKPAQAVTPVPPPATNKIETPPAAQPPAQIPPAAESAPAEQKESGAIPEIKPEKSQEKSPEALQPTPPPAAPTAASGKVETPVSDKRDLTGYQLIPGETGVEEPVPRMCATGCPAAILPFGEPPLSPPGRVEGEIGLSSIDSDDLSGFWLSPLFRGQYRVADTIVISADWGFSYVNASLDDEDKRNTFRMGNPFLAVHFARRHGCTELRVGIGATIPLARVPKNEEDQYLAYGAYYGAMAIRGMWEWWLWYPNAMAIALPLSWETVLNDQWSWGAAVALAGVGVYGRRAPASAFDFLSNGHDPRRANLAVPISAHVGYHIGLATVGAYVQSIFIVTGKGEKQLSLVPFAKLELGDGYLEGRFTLNIDEPLGFAFSKDGYWGLQLGGGYGF